MKLLLLAATATDWRAASGRPPAAAGALLCEQQQLKGCESSREEGSVLGLCYSG